MREYSREEHFKFPTHVHGLMVFRRDAVLPHLEEIATYRTLPEWRLTTRVAENWKVMKLPFVGRMWRQHGSNAVRRADPEKIARFDLERMRA